LLGPSGCGKTTTLRLIAGFETPDTGTLRLAGEDVARKRPYERSIGLLFQHYALFPHMSVADNIAYGLRHRGFPRQDIPRLVAEMLALVKLGSTEELVEAPLRGITGALTADGRNVGRRGFTVTRGEHEVERIWNMRKKAVGLLGNMQGDKRPIPFVEDIAVPPEHLADYIAEFRAALDARGLSYGMFGHVDANVLHVRPAIDMKDPLQEGLIREITEEVVLITRKYHGLLWGEHGKGVRSEFSPTFFGPLYPALQSIKSVFDPGNQLNLGKIAAPQGAGLLRIDELTTRGQLDRTIAPHVRAGYDEALHCNRNGACFNWDPDDAMCPSYKATRERRHLPKGRAALVREWQRQLAALGCDPLAEADALRRAGAWRSLPRRVRNTWSMRRVEPDFSHEVKAAMDGCLACKSCVGQCPIKVDVPTFRAKFLELYYGRYLRPARHYIVGAMEHIAPVLACAPGLHNALIDSRIGRTALRSVGLVHSPALSRNGLRSGLRARGISVASPAALRTLSPTERATSLVVVQDAFTSHYEAELLLDLFDLLRLLGFRPWIAPYRSNGKPLHVHGFLGAFRHVAASNAVALSRLAATGVRLVGVDPSMTLTYRSEYASTLGQQAGPAVMLIQEWLAEHLDRLPALAHRREYFLLPHCTERTNAPASLRQWQAIFAELGASLRVLPSGCCGMGGTYGHELEHRATSERIYALSWSKYVDAGTENGNLLATSYSCRSPVALIDGVRLLHPIRALLGLLRERAGETSSSVAQGTQVGGFPPSDVETIG
jgi:Fe-S oxidoreductase